MLSLMIGLAVALLTLQLPATVVLLSRLAKGKDRRPPLKPRFPTPEMKETVSVLVPTLNEEKRLSPCLAGLQLQTEEVREILIIDSNSGDGTQDLVKSAIEDDRRLRLLVYDPLADGWVGPTGALHHGFLVSSPESEWILRLDADTRPRAGLVASLIKTAVAGNYDVVSLSGQFILKYPGELLLHPSLLMTFAYRFAPVGKRGNSRDRVMGNGQCFLCRRWVLDKLGGYSKVRHSFCEDMSLTGYAARLGFKVGFLDGSKLLQVRMYEGAAETWREWGRMIDLKDALTPVQVLGDVVFLLAVQGLPLLVVLGSLFVSVPLFLLGLNLFLLLLRGAMLWAIVPYYDRSRARMPWLFWLSPLVDPLAWLRVFLSAISKPKQWRGRSY